MSRYQKKFETYPLNYYNSYLCVFQGHNHQFASAQNRILFDDRNRTSCREMDRRPRFSSYLMDHSVPAGGTMALQVEVRGNNFARVFDLH